MLRSLLFLLALGVSSARAQGPLGTEDVRAWHSDLAFLRTEMPARHANLFHAMSPEQFDSAITAIDHRLPTLARHEVIVELEKLAALIGDGHSNVGPWRDTAIAFHTLPVALYWFPDGISIRAADSAHANLLGARIVRIGNVSIDSAVALVTPLVSRDNAMAIRYYAPLLLAMPEVLHAVHVVPVVSGVQLVVEVGGVQRTVMLSPAGLFPMLTGDIDKSWNVRSGWIDARDNAPPALWLSNTTKVSWFRFLPDEHTMYCQINTIQDPPGDSLHAFMTRTIAAADSLGAARLVLDLRLNGGGDGTLNPQIFLPLIKSRYDAPGKLFVVTGRRTFSAAQMLVTELEKYTSAIFVGEPTSSHGNAFGDSYRIVLPNSRVTVRVSTLWHQYLDSRDKRELVEPGIPAPLAFADYAAGRDPALMAIFRRPP